jgi:hypothetical protein
MALGDEIGGNPSTSSSKGSYGLGISGELASGEVVLDRPGLDGPAPCPRLADL